MTQVKVFDGQGRGGAEDLEEEINDWLERNQVTVITVSYSVSDGAHYAMVVYKT